jgi:hypothetical protein
VLGGIDIPFARDIVGFSLIINDVEAVLHVVAVSARAPGGSFAKSMPTTSANLHARIQHVKRRRVGLQQYADDRLTGKLGLGLSRMPWGTSFLGIVANRNYLRCRFPIPSSSSAMSPMRSC